MSLLKAAWLTIAVGIGLICFLRGVDALFGAFIKEPEKHYDFNSN